MANGLYDTYIPQSRTQQMRRSFSGDWRDRLALGISGYNDDGTTNAWGEAKGVVLPVALGIVGGIYGGAAGAKLGSAVGQLGSQALSGWGGNIFEGTDTYDTYLSETQDNAAQDSIGGMVGEVAGNLASDVNESGSLRDYFSGMFNRGNRSRGRAVTNAVTDSDTTSDILSSVRSDAFNDTRSVLPNLNERLMQDYRVRDYLNRNRRRSWDTQPYIEGFNTSVPSIDRALGYNINGILG